MSTVADRLALGTAQLGQRYGIANRGGEPDEATADAVLRSALSCGVRYLDTAQAYGRSEEIVGDYMCRNPDAAAMGLRLVTKLLAPAAIGTAELEASLQGSWERLGRTPIWGMLLHRETMLDQWEGRLGDTLRRWRDQGRIMHLGVSVYTPEGMRKAIETPGLEVIQAPASACDRRMYRAGLLARAQTAGKRLFVRSVFLQGLMLLRPDEAARRLPTAVPLLTRLDAFCIERGIDRRRFAIGYVRHCAPNALLVIGSETPAQVADNCRLISEAPPDPQLYEEWDAVWSSDDELLVNPSSWPEVEAQ
jgi:aryl-alcohol dehydrogenase-like predicted oxidoreductase